MPSLKALKNRIASVRSTKKITKAKQMVAAVCVSLTVAAFAESASADDDILAGREFDEYRSLLGSFGARPFDDVAHLAAEEGAQFDGLAFTLVREFRPNTYIGIERISTNDSSRPGTSYLSAVVSEVDYEARPRHNQKDLIYEKRVTETFFVDLGGFEIDDLAKALVADGLFDEARNPQDAHAGCLHAAHYFFEARLNGETKIISRTGCAESEFIEDLKYGRGLVVFAAERMPAAKERLGFALEMVGRATYASEKGEN